MLTTLRPIVLSQRQRYICRVLQQLHLRMDQQTNLPKSYLSTSTTDTDTDNNINIVGGDGKNRIVILGTGWAGFNLALNLKHDEAESTTSGNENIPEVRIVSPSNHFVFTPLIPSTAVGTLEFRCIQEPIRKVMGNNGKFVQAKAMRVDADSKILTCRSVHDRKEFNVKYDKLVIGVGVKTDTFGIDSIVENESIFFLKHLWHARNIRNHIIDSFERASIPGTSKEERTRLLSFIVVGGGPTSCEFVAELHSFATVDIARLYPDMVKYVRVTLVEAGSSLLGPFDSALQEYTKTLFQGRDIDVLLDTSVQSVEDYDGVDSEGKAFQFIGKRAILSDGNKLPFGTMVWSAGLKPVKFTDSLDIPKDKRGRILVDEYLRVKGYEGSIWAVGDAAICEKRPLPQLAQVARQQGMYLGDVFNGKQKEDEKPFNFFNLGSMALVGNWKGIYDGKKVGYVGEEVDVSGLTGFGAFLMWRFAYWGRQTSLENKLLIPMYWFKAFLFGRDISRF